VLFTKPLYQFKTLWQISVFKPRPKLSTEPLPCSKRQTTKYIHQLRDALGVTLLSVTQS